MTTFSSNSEGFMNNSSRSPRSNRQPQLHRQTSRPFDAYGTMPTTTAMFPSDDNMSFPRGFESGRNHFNAPMQSAQMNGGQYSYDLGGSQTWNPAGNNMQAFGGNQSALMGGNGGLAGQSRLKPSRGRAVIPNVCGPLDMVSCSEHCIDLQT